MVIRYWLIQSLKVKCNPVRPIFLGPCKNRWHQLATFKWRKPNYSFLKEFLYLIVNDSLFNFSKWGMRSGGTKKRLRFKVKINMTVSDCIQDKWIRCDFLPHMERVLQTPRLRGFAIIVATELWLTSSEDPTGSWLTMTWGFDGAVLVTGLVLKKN